MSDILVVEDDCLTRKLARLTLQSDGHRVRTAEDGQSAQIRTRLFQMNSSYASTFWTDPVMSMTLGRPAAISTPPRTSRAARPTPSRIRAEAGAGYAARPGEAGPSPGRC